MRSIDVHFGALAPGKVPGHYVLSLLQGRCLTTNFATFVQEVTNDLLAYLAVVGIKSGFRKYQAGKAQRDLVHWCFSQILFDGGRWSVDRETLLQLLHKKEAICNLVVRCDDGAHKVQLVLNLSGRWGPCCRCNFTRLFNNRFSGLLLLPSWN